MAKPFGVQRVSTTNQPGTFRGLDASSRSAMLTPDLRTDLSRFDRIIKGAEAMARRSLGLGERGLWSSHPEVSVRWGNLVDEYSKQLFQTSADGAALRQRGWQYTPRGLEGGDFVNSNLKQVVDPCGLSSSSVRTHRKYLSGGNTVVVRTGGPTGGGKLVHSGGGRAGGIAQLAAVALETAKDRERIAEDAGLGVMFLPIYDPFVAKRDAPPGSLQAFDPRFAIRTSVVDERLFASALQTMPVGSTLPLEYPIDRVPNLSWISDVSSRERVNRLSDIPNEFLVWAKQPDGWHLARSDRFLPKPYIAPMPQPGQPQLPPPRPVTATGGLAGPMPWDLPKSWLPGHGPQQSTFVPAPSALRVRPTPVTATGGGLTGPMPWDLPKSWLPGHGPQQSIHVPDPSTLRVRPKPVTAPIGTLSGPMPWDLPKSWLPGAGPQQSIHVPDASPLRVRPTPVTATGGDLSGPMPWDLPKSWLPGHGPQQSTLMPAASNLRVRPTSQPPLESRSWPLPGQSHPLAGAPYL